MFENSNGSVNVKEAMPKTEVVAKAKRKRFTAAEKLRILREVDACQGQPRKSCAYYGKWTPAREQVRWVPC